MSEALDAAAKFKDQMMERVIQDLNSIDDKKQRQDTLNALAFLFRPTNVEFWFDDIALNVECTYQMQD